MGSSLNRLVKVTSCDEESTPLIGIFVQNSMALTILEKSNQIKSNLVPKQVGILQCTLWTFEQQLSNI